MTGKKISDQKLKKEIKRGKTEKEIAYDHGYGYPSSPLNRRIQELGFEKNQKINIMSSGGGQFYLSPNPMQKMARQKNIDLQTVDKVFFQQVGEIKDGRITLEMTKDSFRKVEE